MLEADPVQDVIPGIEQSDRNISCRHVRHPWNDVQVNMSHCFPIEAKMYLSGFEHVIKRMLNALHYRPKRVQFRERKVAEVLTMAVEDDETLTWHK